MLYATYTLGACLLMCQTSQKSMRGISNFRIFVGNCKPKYLANTLHPPIVKMLTMSDPNLSSRPNKQPTCILSMWSRYVFTYLEQNENGAWLTLDGPPWWYVCKMLMCCMGIWCYAKLETIGNPREKKIARSMTSLQYLPNFAPALDNLKSFQWARNSRILWYNDQLLHWNFLKKIYRQILVESLFLWK